MNNVVEAVVKSIGEMFLNPRKNHEYMDFMREFERIYGAFCVEAFVALVEKKK